LIDIEVI